MNSEETSTETGNTKAKRPKVPTALSDIYFALDRSEAEELNFNGIFVGYKEQVLLDQAQSLLNSLAELGVSFSSVEACDLVEDMLART